MASPKTNIPELTRRILAGASFTMPLPFGAMYGGIDNPSDPMMYLTVESAKSLRELTNHFLSECPDLSRFANDKGLEDELAVAVRSLITTPPSKISATDAFKAAVNRTRALIGNWSVRLPVINLNITETLHLGGMDLWTNDDATAHFERLFHRPLQKQYLTMIVDHSPNASCWAITCVRSHPAATVLLARRAAARVINVLRACVPLLHDYYIDVGFGLPTEIQHKSEAQYILTHESSVRLSADSVGMHQPLHLKHSHIVALNSILPFDDLCNLALSEADLTSFSRRIFATTQWIGRASIAPDDLHHFLDLIIALEQLLGPKGESITEHIAIRTAMLLSGRSDRRRIIYRQIKSLYALRSRLVHSGSEAITNRDLTDLRRLATGVLVRSSRLLKRFSKIEDFHDYLDEQKFGPPVVPANLGASSPP